MRITKKKVFTAIIIIVLIAAAVISFLIIYAKKQMEKIPAMTAQECLDYTLRDSANAVISIGTIKNGESGWTVFGNNSEKLPDELHTYEIGSVTKTVTAAMIAAAVRDWKINADDTIETYLELPTGNVYPTISELLTHTSGYAEHYFESPMIGNFFTGRNSFCGITDDMILNRLGKLSTAGADKSWRYSNFGFAVLGQILESVYDREYTELADDFLHDLGMTKTHISDGEGDLGNYWDWKPGDAYMSAGAVVSDIDDMLTYAQLQLDNDEPFALTHNALKEVNATPADYEMLGMRVDSMGMAWIIDGKNGFIWHNGATGNYNSYVGFCPGTQTAVVVLSNLSPNYRIPATVIGVKLLEEAQHSGFSE